MARSQNTTKTSLIALLGPILSGCSLSPSIVVAGAYFPDWLFCIIAGLVLTLVACGLAGRTRYASLIYPVILVQASLFALFSLAVWLIFF